MRNYVIRRVLLMIPTIFIVTIIVFFLIRLIPGNIVDSMIGQVLQRGSTEVVDRAAIEHALGLDVPVLTQYARWIGVVPQMDGSFSGILQGDLGVSLWRDTTVLEEIAFRWPVTLELGVMGLIISQLIALPIGVFSALRQDKWGDYIGRSFAIMCMAVPGFWIGTLVIVFPSLWWGYMPPILLTPFTEDPIGNLQMFIIPAVVLGMAMGGMTMRMTRTMMLEVLRQDYIRTAWAKGLRERIIVMRHTLKNALIPVITVIGWQVPVLVGGTVIIEQIFCLPGMGRLFLDATLHRDYPVVSGVTLVFGLGMVLINLVVDITYGFLDPRVHYR
ncbi:Glutathione transport system permease protein GsiC [subsurface metagenome]